MAGHSQYKETLWPWRPHGRLTHALARHTDPHTTELGATLINPTSSLALPPAAGASTFLFPPASTPIFLLITAATSTYSHSFGLGCRHFLLLHILPLVTLLPLLHW